MSTVVAPNALSDASADELLFGHVTTYQANDELDTLTFSTAMSSSSAVLRISVWSRSPAVGSSSNAVAHA